jgi:hypothetical protein
MKTMATYRLIPKEKEESPVLTGKTCFFWTSPSGFLRARELYPEIERGRHFSGPGLTHRFLCRQKLEHPPEIFLSLADFLEAAIQK